MDIEKLSESFKARVRAWHASQENQTDAIEYERSFIEAMDQISEEVLRESVEVPSLSARKKK